MRVVATGIDDANANARAGQITGGLIRAPLIQAHETLTPRDRALVGKVREGFRQGPQLDLGRAGIAEFGCGDEPLPIVCRRFDVDRPYRVDPAAEQTEPRDAGIVGDGLNWKTCSV